MIGFTSERSEREKSLGCTGIFANAQGKMGALYRDNTQISWQLCFGLCRFGRITRTSRGFPFLFIDINNKSFILPSFNTIRTNKQTKIPSHKHTIIEFNNIDRLIDR